VKCPFVCSNKPFSVAAVEVPSFCFEEKNGKLQLKRKQYFYQIQTQLFVTQMLWCDFVVWSPNECIVVERINYDEEFCKMMVSKARTFYFDTFLPSVVPCTIISFNSPHATTSSLFTCAAKEEPLTPHKEDNIVKKSPYLLTKKIRHLNIVKTSSYYQSHQMSHRQSICYNS